jgi:hypothetical protein
MVIHSFHILNLTNMQRFYSAPTLLIGMGGCT